MTQEIDSGPPNDVFVITPIGEPGSPERVRADDLLHLVIEPVLEDLSGPDVTYRALRADLNFNPGSITVEIVRMIIQSAACVVDQTGRNPNVFYEMGIADAFNRPTVRIADDPSALPFDSKDHNTIAIASTESGHFLGRDVPLAVASVKAQLSQALQPEFVPSSIVTAYGHHAEMGRLLGRVAEEGGDVESSVAPLLAEVFGEISSIRDEFSKMRRDLLSPSWPPPPSDRSPASMVEAHATRDDVTAAIVRLTDSKDFKPYIPAHGKPATRSTIADRAIENWFDLRNSIRSDGSLELARVIDLAGKSASTYEALLDIAERWANGLMTPTGAERAAETIIRFTCEEMGIGLGPESFSR